MPIGSAYACANRVCIQIVNQESCGKVGLPVNCIHHPQDSAHNEGAWPGLQGDSWPRHEAGRHAPDVPLTGHPGTGSRACKFTQM